MMKMIRALTGKGFSIRYQPERSENREGGIHEKYKAGTRTVNDGICGRNCGNCLRGHLDLCSRFHGRSISALYNAHNATGKNRFSILDITEENEEPDPLERISRTEEKTGTGRSGSRFCPFCGTAVRDDFEFCDQCGKKLP